MSAASKWAALGKDPIQAGSAAGKDVRDDPAFDELQAEVQKAVSVVGGSTADWEKVVTLSSTILALKSKDILVAGYFAVGLIHTRGVDGFGIGSGVYIDLIQNYWDDLFPAKARPLGRARAIAWWIEKTAAVLRTLQQGSLPEKQLHALSGRFELFQNFLNGHLEDGVTLAPITDWLTIAAARSDADAAASSSTESAQPLLTAAAPAGTLSEAQINQTFERIAQEARTLSSHFSARDAANPAVYRLNRMSLWITVDELPPVSEGRTLLTSPEPRLMDHLLNLASRGDYETLLKAAEDETLRFIFWLDLHRFCADALIGMGDRFKNAAETVCRETTAFVGRLPGLENLTFSDGTPFADEATLLWLRQMTHAPRQHGAPEPAAPALNGALEGMEEIKQLLRSRKTADAALHFQTRLRAVGSAREKFLYRLEFMDLLARAASGNLISQQADQLLEDIDLYRLHDFEPALALRAMTAALKACRTQSDAGSKKRAEELLHRIARIDMAEFFKQGG